jgi:hypothetical protein
MLWAEYTKDHQALKLHLCFELNRMIPVDFQLGKRGVAIFAKACFGHPCPSKQQKLNATANAFGAPIRPRHLVPTQQGVGT